MKELLLIAVLVTLPFTGQAWTCYCHDTLTNIQPCGGTGSCQTSGACLAKYVRIGDSVKARLEHKCLSFEERFAKDICQPSYTHPDDSTEIFCCYTDYCNKDYTLLQNPFNVTSAPPTTNPVLAPSIAIPVAVFVFAVVVVAVIVTIAVIRCRKKRTERARRGNMVEKELSCDIQPEYRLDEFTDPSGSGFGLPHLEQRTIGKSIKLGELIGSGRYGQVLLGDYQGEEVAVKKFLSIDGQSWSREIEVYTTNLLTHDCILRFIASDMISDNGATELWLITQYHPHGSLYDYLNRHELSARTLMQMMVSICSGLAHLHTELYGTINKSAIAHRDIKTRNILVKSDLRCCIADFGLAVMKSREDKLNVPKNPKQGTKRYMAPEILDESINVNYFESFQHTDIYAVGLVFWEMSRRCGGVSGGSALDYEPPFQGLVPPDPSFDDMKRIVVVERRQPSIPPRWHQDELLKSLLDVTRECWSYSSDARPHAVYLKKKLSKLSQEDKLDYEKVIE